MTARALLTNPLTLAAGAIALLLAIGEALSPGFAQGDQIVRLTTVAAILGIVAAGQNLVILGGREGIDLSVGPMVSLGAVIAGNVMAGQDAALLPAVLRKQCQGDPGIVTELLPDGLRLTLPHLGVIFGRIERTRDGFDFTFHDMPLPARIDLILDAGVRLEAPFHRRPQVPIRIEFPGPGAFVPNAASYST